jgi:hypothetical protein
VVDLDASSFLHIYDDGGGIVHTFASRVANVFRGVNEGAHTGAIWNGVSSTAGMSSNRMPQS